MAQKKKPSETPKTETEIPTPDSGPVKGASREDTLRELLGEEIVSKVSTAIIDQARTTMYLQLEDMARSLEKKFDDVLRMKLNGAEAAVDAEISEIMEFVRGKVTKEQIWMNCPLYREQLVDRFVAEWRTKT